MRIIQGNSLEVLKTLEENSVDSVVTDPPYGLSFMGKHWDYDVPQVELWREVFRVLKPGGHLLAFAGTRTQHRMAANIEDAGFEIRDMIAWVYGSGFPKSLNVGKSINQLETNEWSKIGKALDNIEITDIIKIWKSNSSSVKSAETSYQKKATEVGTPIDKKGTVQVNVLVQVNQEKPPMRANTVVLSFNAHQATHTRISTALQNVEAEIKQSQNPVRFVELLPPSQNHKPLTTSIVQENVKDMPSEGTANKLRVEEALKTLRGNQKYSDEVIINAICVVLTDNLLHTILSQSKAFQNLDTTLQTECASAITATITEYTRECLTTYTVDLAKSIVVDKLQGNERKVVGQSRNGSNSLMGGLSNTKTETTQDITKGNSPYEGWGTALKPALEPITVARKPISEKNIAQNVLEHGTGGINIDGCRVEADSKELYRKPTEYKDISPSAGMNASKIRGSVTDDYLKGRFPANLIHDGSDEVVGLFPETKSQAGVKNLPTSNIYGGNSLLNSKTLGTGEITGFTDSGSAARFFYCAKAGKSERNKGLEGFNNNKPMYESHRANYENTKGIETPYAGAGRTGNANQNNHPTVKPVKLMQYLVKLVTPKNGTVLDPFNGSGTTGIACKLEGMEYIGIELDPEYCKISEARIEAWEPDKQEGLF